MQNRQEPDGSFSLSLGLERIGLAAIARPILSIALVALVTAVAWLGISRIKVDDSLTELFRADTPEFNQYEALTKRFPSSEFDVLIVVEGKDLLKRPQLEALANATRELNLVDGMTGLVSLFSAREAPQGDAIPAPIIPDELPEGAAYEAMIAKVKSNEIIRGKLLSDDGELALIVMGLDKAVVESRGLADVVSQIDEIVRTQLKDSGLALQLSGAPIMQLEIRNAVERDQLTYNGLGLLVGALIAIVFFRRFSLTLMTVVPPLLAIVWSLGTLGWMGFKLNLFLNVMTPLIMVMGFSDSMQISFAIRDRLVAGDSKREALRSAILTVGPACVLTDGTAALSFLSLLFSDSALIRTFGLAGALSSVMSYFAVIAILPLLGLVLIRREERIAKTVADGDRAMDILHKLCGRIADVVLARPATFAAAGLALLVLFALAHMSLEPRYRLADQVPDREQALRAGGRLDAKLTGANPVHVEIDLPKGVDLYSEPALGVIAEVHAAVEGQKGIGNVWSVETLRRWIIEKLGKSDAASLIPELKRYVEILPPHLVRRFISEDNASIAITGRVPDEDASLLLPVVDSLDARLAAIRKAYPDYQIYVTGLPAIAARNSASMISQLNWSLTGEMIFVSMLLGLAFRSVSVAVVSMLPGLFPIVASGTLLWALGEGLQFASVIALVVAFGLGLDATIHFLNRLRLENRPEEEPAVGIRRAILLMGPALMLTTIVLACGLAVTMFSDLPSLRLFGWLAAVTLISALIGDLMLLPAVMLLARRWRRRAGFSGALGAGRG